MKKVCAKCFGDHTDKQRCRSKAPIIAPRVPLKPSNAAVRRIIARFEEQGTSGHSKNGGLLGYLLLHCEQNKIGYRVTYVPDGGYYIEKWPAYQAEHSMETVADDMVQDAVVKDHAHYLSGARR